MHNKFMKLAVTEARKNIRFMTGGPFGACIGRNGTVIAVARNTVLQNDAPCHAEVNAIRAASRKLGGYDLSGCQIYSTTEPCPMCFSAIHGARIKTIIFGTSPSDARKIGFNELNIPAAELASMGKLKLKITGGVLLDECRQLFNDWSARENKRLY
jgi:guanine deaminase